MQEHERELGTRLLSCLWSSCGDTPCPSLLPPSCPLGPLEPSLISEILRIGLSSLPLLFPGPSCQGRQEERKSKLWAPGLCGVRGWAVRENSGFVEEGWTGPVAPAHSPAPPAAFPSPSRPVPPQECNAAIHKKCIDKIIGRCTGTAANSRDTIVRPGPGGGRGGRLATWEGFSPAFPRGAHPSPHFSWSVLRLPDCPVPGGALLGILPCMGLGES